MSPLKPLIPSATESVSATIHAIVSSDNTDEIEDFDGEPTEGHPLDGDPGMVWEPDWRAMERER